MADTIGYALLGAGGFGGFCVEQYLKMDQVRVIGVFDRRDEPGLAMSRRFGIQSYTDLDAMLADPEIEIVQIATPPSTHREFAERCLLAGKHVLCEKPLSINPAEGLKLIESAERAGRVLAVNLIMRYDPVNQIIKQILDQKILGEPIAGSLMNLASDAKLVPDHWFWDKHQSGGIFIEHGVHFFDLFEYWLGTGIVKSAMQSNRPSDNKIAEQVRCTIEYGDGILVDHYHGFHQATPLDRQELRIICERGDILIRGWLSLSIHIDALLTREGAENLKETMKGLDITSAVVPMADGPYPARHKSIDADGRYAIDAHIPMSKPELYGKVTRDLLSDQIRYINDRSHTRRITEANGLRSLEVAHQATLLADAMTEQIA